MPPDTKLPNSTDGGILSWLSGDVRTNGIRLHYYRTGGSKPQLILVHGFSDDGLCWTRVARAMEGTYDVVMPDARGHGRSEAPALGYGPLDYADDLAGVIAELGLRRPILLGHSMGAISVLTMAGRRSEVPRGVVLEDPPAWWSNDLPPPFSVQWRAGTQAWLAELRQHTLEEVVTFERAEEPGWPEEDLLPWADFEVAPQFKRLPPGQPNRS